MIQGRFRRTITVALLLIAAALSPASLAVPAGASQAAALAEAAAISVITQRSIIRANMLDPDDRFGMQIAIDAQTAVIASMYDDGPTNTTPEAGAVYVFVRDANGGWEQQAVLRAANPNSDDFFGSAIAIDGDTIVVGAPYDDGPSNSNTDFGAVYVFVRSGGNWTQQAVLRSLASGSDDLFGENVDISGNTVVVGARGEDGPSNTLTDAGAAYVFERSLNGSWSEKPTLRLPNAAEGDGFGTSVAIDGDMLAVGASRDDGPSNNRPDSGSVAVFRRSSTGWGIERMFNSFGATPMDPNDRFGGSLAVDGNTLVVGALGDAGLNNNLTDAGAAYVFARTQSDWEAVGTLQPSSLAAFDWFGEAVALSGGQILIGASLDDGSRNNLADGGAVYFYLHSTAPLYIPLIQR